MQLQGHGPRRREQLGPRAPGDAPTRTESKAQRFRCVACGKTVTVLPRGALRGRRYAATAVALALCLFGLERQSHDQVRDAVGMFQTARDPAEGQRWSALVAWSRAARAGLLVAEAPTTDGTLRDAAARLAQVIAGYGPRGDDQVARVFGGALRAPWRGTS